MSLFHKICHEMDNKKKAKDQMGKKILISTYQKKKKNDN